MSEHPGLSHEIMYVAPVPVDQHVYRTGLKRSSRTRILRCDKKSVLLMNDVLVKCSNHGQLVLQAFAGTVSIENVCLLFDKQALLIPRDKNINCLQSREAQAFESLSFSVAKAKIQFDRGYPAKAVRACIPTFC